MAEPERLTVPATLADVRLVAEFVRRRCAEEGLDELAQMDFELAAVEAANNIVIHGYAANAGTMTVSLAANGKGTSVVLEDHGMPMKVPARLEPASADLDESGRGLSIIAACTDRMDYASEGGVNRLVLFKARPQG